MNPTRVRGRVTFWAGVLAASAALLAMRISLAQEPVVDPPGRVARLSLIDGEVTMAPADSEEWADAVLNRPLTSGDRLAVGSDGRAELQIGSASVHLDRDTHFGFVELDDDVMQMSLTDGAATLRVRRLGEHETIQVETPNATVFLRHTGEYHLEIDSDADQTIVKTRSGEAEVVGRSKSYHVRANEQGVFSGLDDLTADIGPIEPRTAFEAWANDRDRRDESSVSSRYVSRDVIGYEDLDRDGEWLYEPAYGHVWRPSYVAYDWAPYRYGRWAWIGPWGWTWIDDARWGFAPFHYGRWAHVRDRWCWVPGPYHVRPVYAPALVGWIGGPSIGVSLSFSSGVGWYPLGPREIYFPGYRHTPRYVRYVNESNTVIVHHTNIYERREPDRHWNRRHNFHDVTVAGRDRFVGGRQIGGDRLRMNDRDLRDWRDHARPPAIAPDRDSVLAGQTRRPPPPRSAFADNPKYGSGDFRSMRQRVLSGEAKRTGRFTPDRDIDPRDRRDTDRNVVPDRPGSSLRPGDDFIRGNGRMNERVEIMRPESSTRDWRQRADRSRPEIRPTPVQPAPMQVDRDRSSRAFHPSVTPGKSPRQEPRTYTPRPSEQPSTRHNNSSDRGQSHSSGGRQERQPSSPKQQQNRNR